MKSNKSILLKKFMVLCFWITGLLLTTHPSLRAQNNEKTLIKGLITDKSLKPIIHVSVLLFQIKDSSLVKGSLTDANGKFSFSNIPFGKYYISASMLQYQTASSSMVIIDGEHTNLTVPSMVLQSETNQLEAVVVLAKKPLFEQKIDRMVINVSNSITSAGSTVLEVLERSPGVMVNKQNNSLSMNGKNGVVVMINGKINRIPMSAIVQMLAGMSADNIEKIELITTPPSNFDAEGNAGYINIFLKSNSQFGTNGSYTITGGYSKHDIEEASFNINHRKDKINLYADLSFSRPHSLQVFEFYSKSFNKKDTIESASVATRDIVDLYYSGKLGLDYQINKKTNIGIFLSGFDSKFSNNSDNIGTITKNNHLDSSLIIVNNEVHDLYNLSGNINVQHLIAADEKLMFNANYDYYNDKDPNSYSNSYYDKLGNYLFNQRLISTKKTPIQVWVETLDYSKKLSSKIDMETGLKSSSSKFENDVSVDTIINNGLKNNKSLTGKFNLTEKVLAAYAAFNVVLSEKTKIKIGLRYEYTISNLSSLIQQNIVDRKYGNFFPSIFFSRKIDNDHSVNISYSKRITRPTFTDMAPFQIFFDPHTFISGNAAIQPSITDAVGISYAAKKKILSISYSYDANPIANFTPSIDSVSHTTTYASTNQRSQHNITSSLSLPIVVNKWWNMQNNISFTWQYLNAIIVNAPVQLEHANYTLSSTHSFSLPKNFSLEISGNYFSKALSGVFIVSEWGMVNGGIQKKFPKKRSALRFNVSNMLNTMVFNSSIDLKEQNLIAKANLRFAYPAFKISFTKNFGNDKVKEKRDYTKGDEEEKARVRN